MHSFLGRLDFEAPMLDEFGLDAFRRDAVPPLQLPQLFVASIRHRLQTLTFTSTLDPANFANFSSLASVRILLESVHTWEACVTGLSLLPALKHLTLDDRILTWIGFLRVPGIRQQLSQPTTMVVSVSRGCGNGLSPKFSLDNLLSRY